jgi:hypothetical protein
MGRACGTNWVVEESIENIDRKARRIETTGKIKTLCGRIIIKIGLD